MTTDAQRIVTMTQKLTQIAEASPSALAVLENAIEAAVTSAKQGMTTLTAADRELLAANGVTSLSAAEKAKQQIADQKARRANGLALMAAQGRR